MTPTSMSPAPSGISPEALRFQAGRSAFLFFVLILVAGLLGCGGSSKPAGPPLPASIRLAPTTASIELGSTLQLIPTALGADQRPITISLTYQSSNPQVVTVANNGSLCAGSWDSDRKSTRLNSSHRCIS